MESSWKRVKRALRLNKLRSRFTKAVENSNASSSSQMDGYTRFASADSFSTVSETTQSPRPTSTGSGSSKKICAICLVKLKQGGGHALFEAECSHTFHFQCIVSNVKHGSNECPICRAKWKEIPFHADQSQLTSFDEEEPLGIQTEPASNIQQGCSKTVDVKTYTEFSEVKRSASQEDFAILMNMKALVEKSRTHSETESTPEAIQPLKSHAHVDLVAVLDVSGSMGGTKLALLKRAMGFVIQNLGPSDRLCVIAFSSSARRLFHLRRMTASGQQVAIQAVNTLVSNGATNIGDGLEKAVKVIDERREKNPICSIILLSDGQDSYVTSSDYVTKGPLDKITNWDYTCLMPVSFRRAEGSQTVSVHAFGFGVDHDSALLHWISNTSGGTFSFVETIDAIQDAFAQCIGGLLSVAVRDVRVCVECVHHGVQIGSIKSGNYMGEVMEDRRKGSVDLGILYADEERNILVFVNIPTVCSKDEEEEEEEDTVLLKVSCTYSDCISKESFHVNPVDVSIRRPEVVVIGGASIEVDRERNRVRAAEVMGEAKASAERGELSEAVSILKKYRKVLSETLSGSLEDSLCKALDVELLEMQERMRSHETYEASGRAYMLSGMSSHAWQRATARGDSTETNSQLLCYRTPSMANMVERSQTFTSGPSSTALVRSARSSQM